MNMQTSCPNCGEGLAAPEELAGLRALCPSCGAVFGLPARKRPGGGAGGRGGVSRAITERRSAWTGAVAVMLAWVASAVAFDRAGVGPEHALAVTVALAAALWGMICGAMRRSAALAAAGLAGGVAAGVACWLVSTAAGLGIIAVAPVTGGLGAIAELAAGYLGLVSAGAAFGLLWGVAEGRRVGGLAGASAGARAALWMPLIALAAVLVVALPAVGAALLVLTFAPGLVAGVFAVAVAGAASLAVYPVTGYFAAMHFALDVRAAAGRAADASSGGLLTAGAAAACRQA